jgi:2-oxoglutarate ferredoxin oxidoreductase subunit gamma
LMIANQSLIDRDFERDDFTGLFVPAQEIAEEIGERRMLNMVMLGAMLEIKPVVPMEAAKKALGDHIAERHKNTLPMNYEAMKRGAEHVRKLVAEKA